MRRIRATHGFTLIEMMVVVLITGVIASAMYQMLQAGQRSSARSRVMVDLQQNARVGLDALGSDLREVSYGKDPTQPSILYAGPDSVVFVADVIPEEPGAEVVTYYLSPDGDPDTENPDDTVLMRAVADTSGNVLVDNPQSYGIASGGLAFRWFNGGGTELDNPVPQPEEVGEIFVELTAAGKDKVGDIYPEMSLSTTIYPRNLPLSPARSRPSTPACTGPTYPNCEAITLNWNTPTTNTDGTALQLEDISHFNLYLGPSADEMSPYTRLARTINSWTIGDLEGGQTYYVGISCESRSGVESFLCSKEANPGSTKHPNPPAYMTVSGVAGTGVSIGWTSVTTFTDGTTISTPVHYHVFRSTSSGFTPSEANQIADVSYASSYVDNTVQQCNTYHYTVESEACGNFSTPLSEQSYSYPPQPAAVSGITATAMTNPGQVAVGWTALTTRTDGSSLPTNELDHYDVYYDTTPYGTSNVQEVAGTDHAVTITGLDGCQTYYFNVRAFDSCDHAGDYIAGNQATATTSAACNDASPAAPTELTLTTYNNSLSLVWPPNTTDCDLQSYEIYYGHTAGGPYAGTEAAQGASPIVVDAQSVIQGMGMCRYDLTGLPACQYYAVRVKCVDNCTTPHKSDYGPEKTGTTTCVACTIGSACTVWGVNGTGNASVNLELYNTDGVSQTMKTLKPTFTGSAKVKEVWFGTPLAKIWAYDGSAGGDGYVGSRPSGSVLNVTDVAVPTWTTRADGIPMMVIFDNDVRSLHIDFSAKGDGAECTASGTGTAASVIDDFDDGNYTGWTVLGGTWNVTSSELLSTSAANNYTIKSASGTLTATTIEAKVMCTGGTTYSIYLCYRLQDTNNCGLFGIRTDTDQVRVARLNAGTFTQTGSYNMTLNDNTWYTLKAVVTGNRVEGYVNCNKVIDVTDGSLWSSGSTGLSTRKATAKFDDVKILASAPLP